MKSAAQAAEVVPAKPVGDFAKVKGFDHQAAAAKFGALHKDAQTGLRRVVAFGLFCFEMQEVHLKQGQFGRWLAQYHPECAREDSKTGAWKATNSLSSWMKLTKDTLEAVGLDVNQYLARVHSLHVGSGDLLLLADADVPKNAKSLRAEICDVLDGKTARQLMLEFKQMDEEGNVKRGRLAGCRGTTREQRADARARQEALEAEEASEMATEWARFTEEQCDDKHLGIASDEALKRAWEAYLVLKDFMEPLALARGLLKGGKR